MKKQQKYIFFEIAIASIILTSFYLVWSSFFLDFDFYRDGKLRLLPIAVASSPILLIYFTLRIFSNFVTSIIFTTIVILATTRMHITKLRSTNTALSWADITAFNNLPIVINHITFYHILGAIAVIIAAISYIIFLKKPISRISPSRKRYFVMICLALTPVTFYNYVSKIPLPLHKAITSTTKDTDTSYVSWTRPTNVQENGILLHLIQTSNSSIPSALTEEEKHLFAELKRHAPPEPIENILFIQCESCWYNDEYFANYFDPLKSLGFKSIRALSPAYGGGTANASFEILTGLPARGHLSGVIYQEYASSIANQTHTLPYALKNMGFSTLSMHNFYQDFWHRNIIKPKLGFDSFDGLESMNWQSTGGTFPGDDVLFNFALSKQAEASKPNFSFLVTVFSHGPYKDINGDLGVHAYEAKLNTTIQDLTHYITTILEQTPNTLIMIYGDHRPGLHDFYKEKLGIDTQHVSHYINADVPVLLYHPNTDKVDQFVNRAQHAPLFCVSQIVNDLFISASVESFEYSAQHNLCSNFSPEEYDTLVKSYPSWLYSGSLFHTN